jgi:hypothetical protein
MLPFFLYFVTGVVTGFQVYSLLSLALYGAPFNPLELLSLLGSLGLLFAAYIALFKPHAAARVALIASLLVWCFYGPALAKTIRTRSGKRGSVSSIEKPSAPTMFSLERAQNLLSVRGPLRTEHPGFESR